MSKNLSKSKYLSGLQCEKRLWLEVNDPDKAPEITESQQRLFDQGIEVGIHAQRYFGEGYLIDKDRLRIYECIEETRKAITRGESIIFEATFVHDNTVVMADIIKKNEDDSWDIIEVKSATRIKDEYIPDLAVQRYVLEGSGLRINKTYIMYINKECVYPDLSNLFVIEDVSDRVENIIHEVSGNIKAFNNVILLENEPAVVIGPHCDSPYTCPFKEYCWQGIGNKSVFGIPKLQHERKLELRERGILLLEQLPQDYPLTPNQQKYIDWMLNGQIEIDHKGIKKRLSGLEYPIHFLDFETDSSPIPRLNGTRPFEQIPFQFSCHILHEDGDVEHVEYLHSDLSDPRIPLVESLANSIKERGSVVVYYAPFERGVLTGLATAFPQYADYLNSVIERLYDQLEIIKRHYRHPDFGNSNSLKSVLPALIPGLSYEELDVREGNQAQAVWNIMIRTEDRREKERMIKALRAYCQTDTLAMVEIHKLLVSIV
ncbi:MAG TPA: DUF2779 domain-containing protein [Thermodesulfobacteriota bacterium]|nr:DUF2779 domain-containing protein [Thermodesulfobacteriota bacterium]